MHSQIFKIKALFLELEIFFNPPSHQIRLAIALLDEKATEKHIEILFDNKECYTVGNEEMLKQVWINLIDNAVKFSPESGTIEIRIKETADGCEVKISDEGCGIPPEKNRIFSIDSIRVRHHIPHQATGSDLPL